MSSSTPELDLNNQLCFAIYSTAHAFAQAYKPVLGPLGLTYPQYLVMLLLWEQDHRSVSELSQPLFLDSGTLTPLLKRMEGLGLIRRVRDRKDERVTRISLTEKGLELRNKARGVPLNILCATGLNLEGLTSLRETVKSLGQSLRNGAPVA